MPVSIYALDDDEPQIDETAYVAPDAVVIGRVTIGPEASVWPGAVLRGDHGYITVGARTSVQDGTIVHCTARYPTIIGDDCVVGHNAHLEGCVVEPRCLIGSGSVTLNRVVIGSGSIVAAGAVLAEGFVVPPGSLVAGVPATVKRSGVDATWTEGAVRNYIATARHHRTGLRRIGLHDLQRAFVLGDEQPLEHRELGRAQLREPPDQPDDHPVGELVVVDGSGEGGQAAPLRP
jgi:carbonic anhydrase/acetyltransferase-like protein (isoleucine patch superfamily)